MIYYRYVHLVAFVCLVISSRYRVSLKKELTISISPPHPKKKTPPYRFECANRASVCVPPKRGRLRKTRTFFGTNERKRFGEKKTLSYSLLYLIVQRGSKDQDQGNQVEEVNVHMFLSVCVNLTEARRCTSGPK